jgi:cell division septation protein DedD
VRLLGGVLVLLALAASAQQTRPLTLTVNETQSIDLAGVTAAYAIDATILDASAGNGRLLLVARAAGRTKVMVIGAHGEHAYDVIVTRPPGMAERTAAAAAARAESGVAELRYSSASREVQASVTAARETKTRRTEASLRAVHQGAEPRGDRARTSIASASYRIFTRRREVTLFDRDVDHSPLTLAATPVRGVHYLDDRWRLHAGYTAYAAYRSFLIPVERQLVAGGGYVFRTGARSTVMPSLFAIRGEGTVASLLYSYEEADRLNVRGELGYSGDVGAAGELAFDGESDRVRAVFRYRPDAFAAAGTAPRGLFGDASWTRTYDGRGSALSASATVTHVARSRVAGAAAEVDHRLGDVLSLTGGASWAALDGARAITIPAGIRADFARFGFGALYRYARSRTNGGGHGLRLSARASLGSFYASAYADRQQNAPTLELIFAERPDLAIALADLGITATSAADVARALREHAELAELGFLEGVTVELSPERTQFGLEAAWLSPGASRQQLRLRVLHSAIESVAARTKTTLATLSYSRRLTESADVFASWSYWRSGSRRQPFAEAGIRQRLDGFPSFGGDGTISGSVFVDEDLDGTSDGVGVAAVVELDGTKTQRTNPDGTFAFTGVSRGSHRVVARVPDRPEAYFTTPSRVEASSGDRLAFGVAMTPARLLGSIVNDAGDGLPGVRVLLARGSQRITATTGSGGELTAVTPPGEWQVSILTDSVPPGYALAGTEPRAVMLDRERPASFAVTLRAHRTITGRAAPNAEVTVTPPARTVRADEQGRFSIRSLGPGTVTLVSGGVEQSVDVPRGPATIRVELAAAATPRRTPRTRGGEAVVHVGAFRVAANASAAAERARAAGVEVILSVNGPLTVVRTAPFATREEAEAAAQRLESAGLDAVIGRAR